jgi:hypothetical protein
MFYIRLILAALAASLAASVQAGPLHRSDTGLGSAVIVPYWTVHDAQDSLLTVRNDAEEPSAVRLRVLDTDGELRLALGLYLNARDQWIAAFTTVDGATELRAPDASCVLLEDGTGTSGTTSNPLRIDLGDVPAGSIEIVEMARAPLESQAVPNGRWPGCATIAQRFIDGLWSQDPNAGLAAPADRIGATISILRVGAGTMSTVEGTALAGFSDLAQHAPTKAFGPDLSMAVDSEAGFGQVRSRVCFEDECRVDAWDEPLGAVAAVLTAVAVHAEISIPPGANGKADIVIHRPLERYETPSAYFTDTQAGLRLVDRNGVRVLGTSGLLRIDKGRPLQVLGFDLDAVILDPPVAVPSPVLGHPALPEFPMAPVVQAGADGGIAEIRFESPLVPPVELTASDGYRYIGEAVIAFGVQQFTNGSIDVGGPQTVLSNYRGTITPRLERRLGPPLL